MTSAGSTSSKAVQGGDFGLYVYNVRTAEAGDSRLDLLVINVAVNETTLEGVEEKLIESDLIDPGNIRRKEVLFTVRPAADGRWDDIIEEINLPRWRAVADLISETLGLKDGFIVYGGMR